MLSKEEYNEMVEWIRNYFPSVEDEGIEAMEELWKYNKDINIIAENKIGIQFNQ